MFWIAGGRLVDFGALPDEAGRLDELERRTGVALRRGGRVGELGAQVPPDEVDEMRILGTYLASHPDTPRLDLDPAPAAAELLAFVAAATVTAGAAA